MFIPLRTNRPPRRRPLVTEGLIILNLLVYLSALVGEALGRIDRSAFASWGHLSRGEFEPFQLITYQFLHDPRGIGHLAFNMLFLWVFGCAVEDRLGRLSFLMFYLIGGAVAGIAHIALQPSPVIGASGSIAGLTGAFLALFPRSRIQVLLIFFIIGVYSIPALWFIGFFFLLDVLRQTGSLFGGSSDRVAYIAHIAGYLYGFFLAFLLLATSIVKREEFDVFYLFRQWRRRTAYRSVAKQQTGGAWESASADSTKQRKKTTRAAPLNEQQSQEATIRSEITRLLTAHDLPAAANRYRALLDLNASGVMPPDRQLDLANQFQAEDDTEMAARAYELFLGASPRHPAAAEVRLMLALLCVRKLGQKPRGVELIRVAQPRLTDPAQRELAAALLEEAGAPGVEPPS
ncbi:MAG: rhomboid family intramembrane serine protease [Phycisphaerales bacterium]|nr:rhomboid family intramembrane serine protease [Phycisphaerae bacterium]NNF43583.1 rhomboid family intramembrane serine protease [Phycisphaerales bacterium]NNM24497.1 rhomboid family intramembrane serine protease [Phycisphaerales bacterium]